MRPKTKDIARGRWRGILTSLGVPAALLDGKHHPCPRCGGKDRFRFTDYQRSGGFVCNQCGSGSGFDLLKLWRGWDFRLAAYEVDRVVGSVQPDVVNRGRTAEQKRDAAMRLWHSASRLTPNDPAGRYLWSRCRASECPSALRFARSLHCTEEGDLPAMLAMLTAPDGTPCQVHRTYLTEMGDKAPIESPRQMMPGPVAKGAHVRLTEPSSTLGLAEGIETAISATAISGIPCWAALSAEMLRHWQPPEGTKHVVVFADNDENYTGQEAAYALARKMKDQGRLVTIQVPEAIGEDWNDVHRARFSTG
ncbi:MAG: toprim domain-containing protein [Pseudolabrys sp.]|jgi:putative DNA primase/helicase